MEYEINIINVIINDTQVITSSIGDKLLLENTNNYNNQ